MGSFTDENNKLFTDEEIEKLKLDDAQIKDMQKNIEDFQRAMDGQAVPNMMPMKDFLSTPSAQILVPKVTLGAMREVSEPMYVATPFFQKVRLKSGQSMVFPSIGTIARAYDIAEGQEIPEETLDWQAHESTEIRVQKVGLRLRFTDEIISDSQWDIVAMMIKAAGRAMARHKERKAFVAFTKHGHTIIDNADERSILHTTGKDIEGNFNNTLSAEDLLDIIIAVMSNEYNPTDLLMHPLAWTAFARSELTGGLSINSQNGGLYAAGKYPQGGSFQLGPNSIQGRIPFGFTVNLSAFSNIDKANKTFDLICLDKSSVGVQLIKTDLQVENFDEPARDIQNMKFIERYNFGITDEGRAVVVAKGISLDKCYPDPMRIKQL